MCINRFPLLAYGTSVPPIPPSMTARPAHGTRHGDSSGTAGGAANKEPDLRAELDTLSGLSFIDSWERVRERYPELFPFYRMLTSAQPRTACVEAKFSRLGETNSDYRSNLSCLSLEVFMQRLTSSSSPTSWTSPVRHPQAMHENIKERSWSVSTGLPYSHNHNHKRRNEYEHVIGPNNQTVHTKNKFDGLRRALKIDTHRETMTINPGTRRTLHLVLEASRSGRKVRFEDAFARSAAERSLRGRDEMLRGPQGSVRSERSGAFASRTR
jgi:hypothetical protein